MSDAIEKLDLSQVTVVVADSSTARLLNFDLLATIFFGQGELMENYHEIEEKNGSPVVYGGDYGDLSSRRVQARIHELYGYLVRELSEAMQELKLKPWKQTEKLTDREAFVNEVGDAMHFFVELCITAGITAEDLFAAYFRMHAKNVERQDNGY
jgi:hypothetical protein